MIHETSSTSQSRSSHSSHASFPIIAVAIIGIFATIFLLVFYYIFVIKCCLNWHRIDILRRFSLSRNRNHHQPLVPISTTPEPKGLHESVIRSIPIFQFRKDNYFDNNECAVCLGEFQANEKLRMIPNCAHYFHIDCIDVWLQNNPNCPLCRNSISISIPSHFTTLQDQSPQVVTNEEDFVVIELSNGDVGSTNVEENKEEALVVKKMGKKTRRKNGYVTSMGDECINVNTRTKGGCDDDQFLIQPIRRSFSMDSASDRQLYVAVQEILQRNSMNHVDVIQVNDGFGSSSGGSSSSNTRLRRGVFSFGHTRSAILPFHDLNHKTTI
ncbi:RING-H2 finger protein ATL16-like [Rutidosis leptorrhynchoides]|uniref:RING-H2 finger protein ATL16-like n=1 Tax=Rutidosis leptorrhynchoides TaxID=125765 RepID=UPI003A99BB03